MSETVRLWGGSAKGTFEAIMSAVECYLTQEDFLRKLICFVTDRASVSFGDNSGTMTTIAGLVEWDIPRVHCLNHKLELAIRKTYQGEQDFAIIRDSRHSFSTFQKQW